MTDSRDRTGAHAATFGARLAGARESVGLSQKDLAKRLGVAFKTVKDWESDKAEPRANKLQMLAGLTGVSLMWLLNGEGDGITDTSLDLPLDRTALEGLLLEMRSLGKEITASADRLSLIETRLRSVLVTSETAE